MVAIYSTFLQRAYDQIVHDVCIGSLPVIFAIDRAGLVGNDGETHQGIFDISYLSHIPNLTVMAPKNGKELKDMLDFAYVFNGPIAIRYPRGKAYEGLKEYNAPIVYGKSEILYNSILEDESAEARNKHILILAAGSMVETGDEVSKTLIKEGLEITFVNIRFLKPFDMDMLQGMAENHGIWVTMEENVRRGGFGEMVAGYLVDRELRDIRLLNISFPDQFIEQGDVGVLKEKLEFDAAALVNRIRNFVNKIE